MKMKNNSANLVASLPKDYLFLQQSLQDFLPFNDIKNMMICLPNHEYKAVIEVKSINYYLKTHEEQEVIESQFNSALNAWDFSFAFYVQTRTIDADDIVKKLQEDADKLTTKELKSYSVDYISSIENLTKRRNGNLIKKNYIIVSCNDANLVLSNGTDEEKMQYAFDKLSINTKKVCEALAPIGLSCHILTNEELLELLFVAINKHSILKADEILSFTSNLVKGPSDWDLDKIDVLLQGLINQLNNMMLNDHEMTGSEIERAEQIIKEVEDLRERNKEATSNLFVL